MGSSEVVWTKTRAYKS